MLLTAVLILSMRLSAGAASNDDAVVERARRVVEDIRTNSYPELKDAEIEIKPFDSTSDYFQTRFTFTSFFFKTRLRLLLKVNRKLFAGGVPDDGLRAIIAHELGHALYFRSRNRMKLMGLVRLACKGFTARFERATDVEAIARGYADGLKSYRDWLYQRIPVKKLEEKRRNYFSPLEIDAIKQKLRSQPELIKLWMKRPPRSLQEIEQASKAQKTRIKLSAPVTSARLYLSCSG